jgi:hypothetical protein
MFKETKNGKTCFNRCGECSYQDTSIFDDKDFWCFGRQIHVYKTDDTSSCEDFKPKELEK